MIMCVLLCYPVSICIYYQQGILFLVTQVFRKKGGGGVVEVFPMVGLFNHYQGHLKRYQEILGISPCGYPPSTG